MSLLHILISTINIRRLLVVVGLLKVRLGLKKVTYYLTRNTTTILTYKSRHPSCGYTQRITRFSTDHLSN